MAERRMFAKTIIDSDAFLDMPLSAQALYFHLSMRADDDGFVNNPKKIQRMVGASEDDCKLLVMKRFILTFESGVIVIKHWKIHNYIQKDRYKETVYLQEKSRLTTNDNNAYTECIQNVPEMEAQVRIGQSEDRTELGEGRIDYKAIIDCYNDTCVSFPKVKALSDSRKKAIKARLNTYSIEDMENVFKKAESSDFLKGKNDRNWQANFDWLMKDSNFAKVLDGNYDNKGNKSKNGGNSNASNSEFDRFDFSKYEV